MSHPFVSNLHKDVDIGMSSDLEGINYKRNEKEKRRLIRTLIPKSK